MKLAADWDIRPFLQKVEIDPGARGTGETLALAARMSADGLRDPLIAPWTRRKILIERATDPRDTLSVLGNIFSLVKSNVGYQPDPLVVLDPQETDGSIYDYVQSPHWTLFVEGLGDCLSHASALGLLSMALGHGFAYRTFKADRERPDRFSHVYALLGVLDDLGRPTWVPADTTVPEFSLGDESPELARFQPHDLIVASPA